MENEQVSGWDDSGVEDREFSVNEAHVEGFISGELEPEEELLDPEDFVVGQSLGWWQRIIEFFWKSPETQSAEQSQRLHELNVTIELYPDAPTGYVLRGEIFAKRREYHLAAADFEKAVALASEQLEQARWGILEQTILDRARHNLDQVSRWL